MPPETPETPAPSDPAASERAPLHTLVLGASVGYVALLAGLVALRIGHPYTLEWEEGAMVDQVDRIAAGLPLYVAPSVEFVTQLYTPLYFYTSALVSLATGVSFWPLRIVSVAGTLATFALIFAFARRETGSARAGVLGMGLFAAAYPVTGAWLDVARVDAFFLPWMLGGAFLVRTARTPGAAAAAGALFVVGYLAKQSSLAVALPLAVYLALVRPPRVVAAFAAVLAVGIGGSTLLFDALSDGWYSVYTLELARDHEIFAPMVVAFWWMDLLRPAPIACLASVYAIAATRPWGGEGPWRARWDEALFLFFFLGACVGASWTGRMHSGGHVNVVLPAYVAMAVVWGIALHRVASGEWLPTRGRLAPHWPAVAWLLAALQLAALAYDPRPLVPTAAQREGGDGLLAFLAGVDGEVYTEWHGHLPARVGKRGYAHRSGIKDILRADNAEAAALLQGSIDRALAEQRFAVVIVDNPLFPMDHLEPGLERHYVHRGRLFGDGREVGPVVGWRYDPHVYVPRPRGAATGR